MRRGRTPTPVVLTDGERQALTSLAHRSRSAHCIAAIGRPSS